MKLNYRQSKIEFKQLLLRGYLDMVKGENPIAGSYIVEKSLKMKD
jgi:hypothetical protein